MIDWQDLTNTYNERSAIRLTTSQMLEHLYRPIGSVEKVSDYLGVSPEALCRKMDLLNIPRLRRAPWPGTYAYKLRTISDKRLSRMTGPEIAAEIGCPPPAVYGYLADDNRRWKRTYKRRTRTR